MKKEILTLYFDCYENLLSQKTQAVLDAYLNEDLSMTEIAEHYGVSRQAIHDKINTGRKQLIALEKKLGLINLLQNKRASLQLIEEIQNEFRKLSSELPKEKKIIIEEIMQKLTSLEEKYGTF